MLPLFFFKRSYPMYLNFLGLQDLGVLATKNRAGPKIINLLEGLGINKNQTFSFGAKNLSSCDEFEGSTPLKFAGSKQCHCASLRSPVRTSLQQIHPAKLPLQVDFRGLWLWFLDANDSGEYLETFHLQGVVLLHSFSPKELQKPSGIGGVTNIWTFLGQICAKFSVNACPSW